MEFSPHPSYSKTQSHGLFPLSLFLPPSFIACWPWHLSVPRSDATRPGIQFIWTMYNHNLYPLQPERLTRQEQREKGRLRFGEWKSRGKTHLQSETPPVVLVKCEGQCFVYTSMSTNSNRSAECWFSDCCSTESWMKCHMAGCSSVVWRGRSTLEGPWISCCNSHSNQWTNQNMNQVSPTVVNNQFLTFFKGYCCIYNSF